MLILIILLRNISEVLKKIKNDTESILPRKMYFISSKFLFSICQNYKNNYALTGEETSSWISSDRETSVSKNNTEEGISRI